MDAQEARDGGKHTERMKELVEYIAKSIASYPDEVKVTEVEEDGRVILRLEVAPDDKGKGSVRC